MRSIRTNCKRRTDDATTRKNEIREGRERETKFIRSLPRYEKLINECGNATQRLLRCDFSRLVVLVNKRWFGLVVRTEGPMYVKLNKQGGVRRSSLIQNSADTQRETGSDRPCWMEISQSQHMPRGKV